MPKAKATKKNARRKKISQAKKLGEVKSLAQKFRIRATGVKQGPF